MGLGLQRRHPAWGAISSHQALGNGHQHQRRRPPAWEGISSQWPLSMATSYREDTQSERALAEPPNMEQALTPRGKRLVTSSFK